MFAGCVRPAAGSCRAWEGKGTSKPCSGPLVFGGRRGGGCCLPAFPAQSMWRYICDRVQVRHTWYAERISRLYVIMANTCICLTKWMTCNATYLYGVSQGWVWSRSRGLNCAFCQVSFSKCLGLLFFFLIWKTVVPQKQEEHQDSLPLFQAGRCEFKCAAYKENGGRTINWSCKSWLGLIFLLFPLSRNEFLLKGSSRLLSVHFYACLLFYTSNRVMYAFLVTPAEAWKGSTFHFHYISFISLFWRKGSIKYKIDITKISFSGGWKVLVVNVTPHKAAELQVTIKDLEKMSAW